MLQSKPPVPVPRTHCYRPVKTEDDEPSGLGRSAPPPVPPKMVTVRKRLGGSETDIEIVEIGKTVDKQPQTDGRQKQPTLSRVELMKQELEHLYETVIPNTLSDRNSESRPWNAPATDLKHSWAADSVMIMVKAERLSDAIQVYIIKMSESGETLKQHIYELRCIADNLDKVSKGTKIAGITGGATTAAGGVAAAAGVILAPFTLGASLALTAVGVGVAAAGGITGASAVIANKVNMTQDKKKIDKTLHDYEAIVIDAQACLKFINKGMEQLRQHGQSALNETRMNSVRGTQVMQLAASGRPSAFVSEANNKASGLIHGFALGMDFFFVQGKDGPKVKKGLESKLAMKIRRLAEDLETGLDELIKIKDTLQERCPAM